MICLHECSQVPEATYTGPVKTPTPDDANECPTFPGVIVTSDLVPKKSTVTMEFDVSSLLNSEESKPNQDNANCVSVAGGKVKDC